MRCFPRNLDRPASNGTGISRRYRRVFYFRQIPHMPIVTKLRQNYHRGVYGACRRGHNFGIYLIYMITYRLLNVKKPFSALIGSFGDEKVFLKAQKPVRSAFTIAPQDAAVLARSGKMHGLHRKVNFTYPQSHKNPFIYKAFSDTSRQQRRHTVNIIYPFFIYPQYTAAT